MRAIRQAAFRAWLRRAAQVAGEEGVPLETFVAAALESYIATHPKEAERLAEARLRKHFEELSRRGQLARA